MHAARWLLSVILALTLISGCSTNPATGRSQLILLDSGTVAAMGVEAKPQMIQEFGGEVRSPELRSYVAQIGTKLTKYVEAEYYRTEWEFITLESDVINAFALPGGKIFVTRGLMSRMTNEAQLAAVLGHEIGHITGRHVDERISQTMVAQYGTAAIGAATNSDLIVAGTSMLTQGTLLHFSRDQEAESDDQGMKYMVRAGYNPEGMVQMLQILVDASAGNRAPEMLSTHPDPARRKRDAEALIRTDYATTPGNSKYTLQKARFDRRAGPYLR